MTYKTAQTVGKTNVAQHRKPNTKHGINACTGLMATFPITGHQFR